MKNVSTYKLISLTKKSTKLFLNGFYLEMSSWENIFDHSNVLLKHYIL